jgi:hypothetical protein
VASGQLTVEVRLYDCDGAMSVLLIQCCYPGVYQLLGNDVRKGGRP